VNGERIAALRARPSNQVAYRRASAFIGG